MIVRTIPVGQLETNCYMVADEATGKAIVIDPGDEPDRILKEASGYDVKYIVITHAHFDHVGAIAEIKEATGAEVAVHNSDLEHYMSVSDQAAFWGYRLDPLPQPDILLSEGDELLVGGLTFVIIHTPGHSPGSISLYDNGVVFTGDTLFAGSVGRTDFPGGSSKQMRKSFERLLSLPDNTTVLSGHGPASTIGRERRENMFLADYGFLE